MTRHSRKELFTFVMDGVALVALFATVYLVTMVSYALMHAPEPEERCFRAATAEMAYCRTQARWEVE